MEWPYRSEGEGQSLGSGDEGKEGECMEMKGHGRDGSEGEWKLWD